MSDGIEIRKTYKLFINGAFPRSESGRTESVHGPDGRLLAHVAKASRKDLRDAVRAARAAQSGWARRTAYNRGQIIYRLAEMLESRRGELTHELTRTGVDGSVADQDVAGAIDAAVYWAGFADKLDILAGSVNPVAGPFLNVSATVPPGVCGLVAPARLEALVSMTSAAIMAGNTTVVLAGGDVILAAGTLGELVATSDVPPGVVNILTGIPADLHGWLADHEDVDLLDVSGVPDETRRDLETRAAENLKRVSATAGARDLSTALAFTEIRTVWHPARIAP